MVHCSDCNSIMNSKEIAFGLGKCFPCIKGNRGNEEEDDEWD
jgi:hypothetical protein